MCEVRAARDELERLFLSFISRINDRFGTNFTEIHKVLRQIPIDIGNDKENVRFAKKNDRNTFSVLFYKKFKDLTVKRYP